MVDIALDGGINLFDTADIYDAGRSEEILGEALGHRRDEVVLATKFGNPMGEDPNQRGGSRRWIRQAVEDSLRRLQTDRIDLFQMHRPDPATPIDETLDALDDLVRDGKILAVGTSCFPAELLVEAQWIAAFAVARATSHRAAAVLDHGPRRRASGAADLPAPRRRCARVGAAQRRLAHREVPP